MYEMLSDDMGILENKDYPKPTKAKLHNITNILEKVCSLFFLTVTYVEHPSANCFNNSSIVDKQMTVLIKHATAPFASS